MVWTGFILVMTGPNGGLFMFHKKLKISWLTDQLWAFQRSLLQGITVWNFQIEHSMVQHHTWSATSSSMLQYFTHIFFLLLFASCCVCHDYWPVLPSIEDDSEQEEVSVHVRSSRRIQEEHLKMTHCGRNM
jgi:hypothetical protein